VLLHTDTHRKSITSIAAVLLPFVTCLLSLLRWGGVCNRPERDNGWYFWSENPKAKHRLGDLGILHLTEIECDDVNWVRLAQDTGRTWTP
jgi:hypothetical protein